MFLKTTSVVGQELLKAMPSLMKKPMTSGSLGGAEASKFAALLLYVCFVAGIHCTRVDCYPGADLRVSSGLGVYSPFFFFSSVSYANLGRDGSSLIYMGEWTQPVGCLATCCAHWTPSRDMFVRGLAPSPGSDQLFDMEPMSTSTCSSSRTSWTSQSDSLEEANT